MCPTTFEQFYHPFEQQQIATLWPNLDFLSVPLPLKFIKPTKRAASPFPLDARGKKSSYAF